MMIMTTAWMGSTLNARASAKAVKGMMPNWHKNPMKMPQGLRMCPHSCLTSTVQPIANMTMASMTVSTVLITNPRISLKLLGGTRQDMPEQMVALTGQMGCGVHMLIKGTSNEMLKN